MATFEAQHRRAKVLEARLENKVQQFSGMAQQMNSDLLYDEESPMISQREEMGLISDIECDLNELSECINNMKSINTQRPNSKHEEVLIRRYHEIHFDYSAEFKNTAASYNRKRESAELFESSNNNLHLNDDQDSSTAKLLRERSSIAASMASINEVIAQAFDAKNSLMGQRNTLGTSSSGINSVLAGVPSFNRMIEGVQRKKYKEKLILGGVIGSLLFFTVWWMFLKE
jgi:Golgi SNAP receptor complex protein 1